MIPLINREEKETRLALQYLRESYDNAPVEQKEGYFGRVYEACTRALYDQKKNEENIINLEYRTPYEGITGYSLAGQILQGLDYQDLENRYMPKKEMVLAENFQYRPDVMKTLFKSDVLTPKEEYVDKINGYITAIGFQTMAKNNAQERQEDG